MVLLAALAAGTLVLAAAVVPRLTAPGILTRTTAAVAVAAALGGQGNVNGTATGVARGPGAGGAGNQPAIGGLLGASTPSAALVTALKNGAGNFTWAAAVVGSNNAAGYQLATELPVMAVGGFNGTDPSPTLAQFQQLVAEGKIHYFIAGRTMLGESGSDDAARIAAWVQANFAAQAVGGATLYRLASA
ncbi:hypothetical protein [Pseudarthrobacter sp. S9]|uniref:hypothetical protein n=1 Tax=Pseudarthrobacter sp. S9 TaxID=3418421 RepID=UPI003D087DA9